MHHGSMNYLRQLLRDWGEWVDRAAEHTGYPTESSIISAKQRLQTHVTLQWQLPGGGSYRYALPSRHAILCYDMPTRLAPIHQGILKLGAEERAVLAIWYAYALHLVHEDPKDIKSPRKPMIWHRDEKAAFIGMTYDALERRVSRARTKLVKIFDQPVASASGKMLHIATVE